MGNVTAPEQTYAAFLRGINVGGNRSIKMADVRTALSALGFAQVRTVLASGNIRFATAASNPETLRKTIEEHLEQVFGFRVGVLVRTLAELECLVATDPFNGVPDTPQTKRYVTFLPTQSGGAALEPEEFTNGGSAIVCVTAQEVLSVVDPSQGKGTIDLMAQLEKRFGPDITTRTWNTILKLLAAR